ncbi:MULTISPECIES: type II toxin-antitoxin system RelE/ParE family toxin [Argonema]|uniref:type II toxin-antitoxin system RelE/ParE family toxin n=1 Tax=Argonema TaxID=2942761 RepID=UPI002011F1EE|nr:MULTISPECIES: type II toxin-antitoxin system RelE/ParE family toxin [Argonema]MCL1468020.1 type II toxin-antitoxin system RelE/ParE family toxin [Argonema galeatum A003/A1]MCL1471008.1 type II toxin-antitoxin system RelE/ParE family toxin [Argonema antarcticum A004/B2]
MSRYILAPSARLNLREINTYLTRRNPQAARSLREKFKQQFKLLADFPVMGQNRDDLQSGLRSFPVDNYLIFYRQVAGGVEIVRVVSGYRDLEILFPNQDAGEEE